MLLLFLFGIRRHPSRDHASLCVDFQRKTGGVSTINIVYVSSELVRHRTGFVFSPYILFQEKQQVHQTPMLFCTCLVVRQ